MIKLAGSQRFATLITVLKTDHFKVKSLPLTVFAINYQCRNHHEHDSTSVLSRMPVRLHSLCQICTCVHHS